MKKAYLFTDGSSRGNPGPGGFGFVLLHGSAGDNSQAKVVEGGGGEKSTTNNRMEISAVIFGLEKFRQIFDSEKTITIVTDSGYVLNGANSWIKKWKNNGWQTSTKNPVSNKDLWQRLDELLNEVGGLGVEILWHQVKGHVGVLGNERCDQIATSFADGDMPELFSGMLHTYSLQLVTENRGIVSFTQDVSSKSQNTNEKTKAKKSRPKGKAYSYVSKVDGNVQVHADWESCKKHVHGRKAQFKRVESRAEENELINLWSKE